MAYPRDPKAIMPPGSTGALVVSVALITASSLRGVGNKFQTELLTLSREWFGSEQVSRKRALKRSFAAKGVSRRP